MVFISHPTKFSHRISKRNSNEKTNIRKHLTRIRTEHGDREQPAVRLPFTSSQRCALRRVARRRGAAWRGVAWRGAFETWLAQTERGASAGAHFWLALV